MIRTIVAFLAVLILLGAAVAPVTAADNGPVFYECSLDADGNIIDCPSRIEQADELYPSFGAGNAGFWAVIDEADGYAAPYTAYLERNGIEDTQETRAALAEHSACTLTADVAAHGEFTVTTTVGGFTYNDEPTWERHAKDLMRKEVTVTATDIQVHDTEVWCRFDMAEILNRGMEVDGRFLKWSGRKPVMGDETGSMGEISIDYSVGDLTTQTDGGTGDAVYVEGGNITVDGGNITVEQVGEKKQGENWFESAVSGIMDTVGGDGITAAILRGVAGIFMEFTRMVHGFIWTLLTWTPNITGNPAVTQIHSLSLLVAGLLAVLVLMAGGILHMTGPIAGVSYTDIRLILPRVLAALAFGAVSLPLLQYPVELARVLTDLFMPFTSMELEGFLAYSAAAILVFIVDAVMLLVVILILVVRGAYLLFGAAISPLLALGWAFPYSKKYASSFIGAWWAALLIAPVDMLVLRFIITLPQAGGDPAGTIGNWVYALAASFLLIAVPYQLYEASQVISGNATRIAYGARQTFHQHGGYTGVAERLGHGEDVARRLDGRYHDRLEERTPDHDRGFGRSPRIR